MSVQRKTCTYDGASIEYFEHGSGPLTLFFQHGWGNAADIWDIFFADYLDLTGLRCIAASYRGHGGSDPALTGYTHESFAQDMFAVADAASADTFVLVGFSMAGKFCRYMECLHPHRVLGQVLIAPVGPEPLAAPRELFASWLDAAPDPSRFRPILAPFMAKPVREDWLEKYCQNVARASRAGLAGTIDMFYESIVDEVSRERVPTLVLAGEADPFFPPDYARRFVAGANPAARVLGLPCGHEIPLEMPKETAWILGAFVSALRQKAAVKQSA
jgi:pimeloyl-ACP methyl ester carboxylesterase